MPRKDEILRVRVDGQMLAELRERAAAEHRTLAGQVRAALAFYLEAAPGNSTPGKPSARAGSGGKST